ncbi:MULTISPECIES: hypothetical protein [Rhizobium]|uniref:hypothetical protein n=1 Tax=Rhizobium TaxID=379 RepID=UPI00163DDE59|nr:MULTISPECIES: hypothetical protein [Rhizobium]
MASGITGIFSFQWVLVWPMGVRQIRIGRLFHLSLAYLKIPEENMLSELDRWEYQV